MAVGSVPKLGTELLEYFEPILDNDKLCFGCFWVGKGHGFRFHKVELMLGEWAAHGQPTARLGTVKNSPDLLGWTEIGPCVL